MKAWATNHPAPKLDERLQFAAPSLAVIPADLRQWVGEPTLVSWIREIVSDIAPPESGAAASASMTEGQPVRRMLTLLIYCYSTGRYGSDEIETAGLADPTVRYLCAHPGPTSRAVRLFRRHYRGLLGVGILRLHQQAWQHRFGPRPGPADVPTGSLSAATLDEAATTYRLAAEAEERIQSALLADAIASDV